MNPTRNSASLSYVAIELISLKSTKKTTVMRVRVNLYWSLFLFSIFESTLFRVLKLFMVVNDVVGRGHRVEFVLSTRDNIDLFSGSIGEFSSHEFRIRNEFGLGSDRLVSFFLRLTLTLSRSMLSSSLVELFINNTFLKEKYKRYYRLMSLFRGKVANINSIHTYSYTNLL